MLKHLSIKNYTLISSAEINFHSGFSVITGETGAGKSILIGALGMLLGKRADTQLIKQEEHKCIVEGIFTTEHHQTSFKQILEDNNIDDIDDNSCILRRELNINGKSRCFINDTPVNLNLLKEIGTLLIDIHSQHQNLLLGNPNFLKDTLDSYAQNMFLRKQYEMAYNSYIKLLNSYNQSIEEAKIQSQEYDFLKFQFQQLSDANLEDGEQENAENELNTLTHAEELKTQFYGASQILEGMDEQVGVISSLRQVEQKLQSVSAYNAITEDLLLRINNCRIELKDISEEIQSLNDAIVFDANRTKKIEERLNTIYSLQQKFRVQTIADLISEQEKLRVKIDKINNSSTNISELKIQTDNAYNKIYEIGKQLRKGRENAILEIETKLHDKLKELGLPNAKVKLELTKTEHPGPTGIDEINFLFSSNLNLPMQSAIKIASGGEISRLMLAFKSILSEKLNLPTVIFDEIDTGVSGKMADKMAQVMQEIAKNGQVISITHLPQIAAIGVHHYKVEKIDNQTAVYSNIRELSHKERIEEIAHMLSGTTITQAATNNAIDLLNK